MSNGNEPVSKTYLGGNVVGIQYGGEPEPLTNEARSLRSSMADLNGGTVRLNSDGGGGVLPGGRVSVAMTNPNLVNVGGFEVPREVAERMGYIQPGESVPQGMDLTGGGAGEAEDPEDPDALPTELPADMSQVPVEDAEPMAPEAEEAANALLAELGGSGVQNLVSVAIGRGGELTPEDVLRMLPMDGGHNEDAVLDNVERVYSGLVNQGVQAVMEEGITEDEWAHFSAWANNNGREWFVNAMRSHALNRVTDGYREMVAAYRQWEIRNDPRSA